MGARAARLGALAGHFHDLGELAHELGARVQTAGGVDEHQVTAALVGLIENVVAHTRGIGAAIALDNRNPCALPPHIELLDGGCSERVGAANNHIFAGMRLRTRDFPDRRGLAGAVDADK